MLARARTAAVVALTLVAATFLAPPAQADRAVDPGGSKVFTYTGGESATFGGYVYFAADDGVHGNELWRTDGTPGGTTLVKDFNVGNAHSSSNPTEITVVGSRLFVRANSPSTELWVLDSPSSAPQRITYAGTSDSAALHTLVDLNGTLIGGGYTGDWFSWFKVAPGSTQAVVIDGSISSGPHPARGVVLGGYAYLAGGRVDGTGTPLGAELYRTDGSTVALVKDIATGSGSSSPHSFFATGNRIYFAADDGFHGRELWTSDGTAAGTRLVKDHQPGATRHGDVDVATAVGNVLYYLVNDYQTGVELWRTDGTAAGTRVVKDIDPGVTGGGVGQLATVGSTVFYVRGHSNLWASDGTATGTKHIRSFGSTLTSLTPAFGKLYFASDERDFGRSVWRSGGTAATTLPVATGGFPQKKAGNHAESHLMTPLPSRLVYTARFAQPAGSPHSADARKVFYVDTTKADPVLSTAKKPTVKGKHRSGERLEAKLGTWSPTAIEQSVEWLLNGRPIPQQTGAYLWLSDSMVGKKVSLRVTARAVGAAPRSVTTTAVRVSGKLTSTRGVAIKGTARVGKTLRAVKPKFEQKGVKLGYQWYAGSKKIKKATKASLKLTAKHRGKRISVRVTATKKHFTKITLKAPRTAKVARR